MSWNRMKTGMAAFFVMLFIGAGCAAPAIQEPGQNTAMGRYVETEAMLPQDIETVYCFRAAGDGLEVFCSRADKKNLLRSADGGSSWEEQPLPWMEAFSKTAGISAADWSPDGTLYLYCYEQGEPDAYLAKAVPGEAELEKLPFPAPYSESGAAANTMRIGEDGDLLIDYYFSLYQYDGQTGQLKKSFYDDSNGTDGFAFYQGTAAISEGEQIQLYDVESGDLKESIPCAVSADPGSSNGRRVLAAGDDGALYYADSTGLYRAAKGSAVQERLVSGSLTSLNTPALRRLYLDVKDNRFYLLCYQDGYRLFTYDYREDVPALPETELTLYSLEDNPTVRQAMGVFQRENPSVYITYQVGMALEGLEKGDVLRQLATQLLAGQGPDILVLDGLPMKSYEGKNALLDLSPMLELLVQDGKLLENVAECFRREDSGIYGVPSRFQVPMQQGSEAAAGQKSLSGLADWLEENQERFSYPTMFRTAREMAEWFSLSAVSEEGIIRKDQLTQFFQDVKRIWDLGIANDNVYADDFSFGGLVWMKDGFGVNFGNLTWFDDWFSSWQAIQEKGEGAMATLFHQDQYIPKSVLGINAASGKTDTASSFIQCVLSEAVQQFSFGDGMPVNADAFQKTIELPDIEEGERFSTYSTSFIDKDGNQIQVGMEAAYPPLEARQKMGALFHRLKPQPEVGSAVVELLIEGIAGYLQGDGVLEDIVKRLEQQMDLISAES